jgi:hypothetical protein
MRRRFCLSSRSESGRRHGRARFALVLLAAGWLANGTALAQEQIAAVLKAREVSFVYHSVVNFYACDELRNHVAGILRALGARDDIEVRVNDCEIVLFADDLPEWDRWGRNTGPAERFRNSGSERRQISHVRIRVMFPVEATPEVLAEIDKDKSRRELVSRVTGDPLVALNDAIVFPAQRREVTLSRRSIRLGPEDCELLEQMIPSVLRELDVEVVRKQLSCPSYERSHIPPKLTVKVLLPVGAPVPGEK